MRFQPGDWGPVVIHATKKFDLGHFLKRFWSPLTHLTAPVSTARRAGSRQTILSTELKGVNHVNSRASRRRWIRNRAWAVIAALLPASECLAVSDSDPAPPNSKQSDTSESGQSGSRGALGTTARTKIPPPRIFSEQELKGGQAVRSEIPPASKSIPDPKIDRLTDEPNRLESRTQPRGSQPLVDIAPSSPDPASNTGPSPSDLLTPISPGPTMVAPEAAPSVKGQTAKESTRQATSTQAAAPDSTVNQVEESKATPEGSPKATPLGTDAVVRQALNTLGAAPSGSQAPNPDSSPAASRVQAPGDAPAATASPQPEPEPKQAPASSKGQNPGKSPERKQDGQVEQSSCATCGGLPWPARWARTSGSDGLCERQLHTRPSAVQPALQRVQHGHRRVLPNLYQCICCPDPCYQPSWEPAAYASFFADYARPRTVTRICYDNLEDMTRPDRNQFWINNVTPTHGFTTTGLMINKGTITNLFARLQQVYLYQEAAGEHGSFFVEYPLPADQPELGTDPGRFRRHQLRHQVAPVRLRDAPDRLPVADLHAQWQLQQQPGERPVRARPLDPDVAEARPRPRISRASSATGSRWGARV